MGHARQRLWLEGQFTVLPAGLYEVEANWETARGGAGQVEIKDSITLSDPHGHVAWDIVNERTRDRLLTGGDFDMSPCARTAAATMVR